MSTGPTFQPQDAAPPRADDMLDVAVGIDRLMNQLAAARAAALDLAHKQRTDKRDADAASAASSSSRFNSHVLAERSFRAETAAALNISERAAENLIGQSEMLQDVLPATMAALAAGNISWRHATIMIDEVAGVHPTGQQRLEQLILAHDERLSPPKFARALRKAREELNPETITLRHVTARQDRGVQIDDLRDGISMLMIPLASVHAHAIYNRLTAAAKAMNTPLEDRTLDQRRADIFTHVMLATIDGAPFGVVPDEWDDEEFVKWFRGITAEVIVAVPVLTLLGQSDVPATLDGVVPIDPATAEVLAAGAKSFTRVLTHPETGVVLSVGRKRYKVPKDLRRLLQIRDLTCRFPSCSIAAQRSDIDHTLDWQYGGETQVCNLAHLCRGHHTIKGHTAWTVTQSSDGSGVLTWTDPSGRTYRTYPQNPFAA
jgi:Domain of unknown function (DUF222)